MPIFKQTPNLFFGLLVFFLAFGWLVLIFAAVGLFCAGTIILSIIISTFFSIFLIKLSSRAKSRDLRLDSSTHSYATSDLGRNDKKNNLFLLVAIISLLISCATCYFATPTIFGGRDQGAIATSAIYLSQNHTLKISLPVAHDLFQKYGPGHALNFPGFDYTKKGDLVSRFPVGFTAYLASAYTLFGLKGIQYTNFVPLFFFLVIFWLILKEFFDQKVSFLGFLLAVSFFPFLWFAKFALTEIYMLCLVWAGIYFLLSLRRSAATVAISDHTEKSQDCFSRQGGIAMTKWLSLAFFALSSLVRIEGMIFFLLAAIYIFILRRKNILSKSKNFNKYLLFATILLFAIYAFLNFPDLLDSTKNLVKAFLPNSTKESAPSVSLYPYLARIFFNYNILPYLIVGLVGIIWLATKIRKNWAKSEFLPILIIFPTFLYLLSPMITLDEPWFLRRFVFAVFPALIFYTVYALQKFFYHKLFLYFVLIVLVATNAVVSVRFFRTSENKDLLPQVEKISKNFGPNDLVLVDRLATGDGFSLMSEPLRTIYGKNAIYFFNAEDLKYIKQDRYKNIYLVAPTMGDEKNPWYADLIKSNPTGAQIVTNNFLEPSDKRYALAQNVTTEDLAAIWKIK